MCVWVCFPFWYSVYWTRTHKHIHIDSRTHSSVLIHSGGTGIWCTTVIYHMHCKWRKSLMPLSQFFFFAFFCSFAFNEVNLRVIFLHRPLVLLLLVLLLFFLLLFGAAAKSKSKWANSQFAWMTRLLLCYIECWNHAKRRITKSTKEMRSHR